MGQQRVAAEHGPEALRSMYAGNGAAGGNEKNAPFGQTKPPWQNIRDSKPVYLTLLRLNSAPQRQKAAFCDPVTEVLRKKVYTIRKVSDAVDVVKLPATTPSPN